ncbi:MAG: hypothetical protein AAF356_10425 [Planctomycetota bacterium]
MTAPTPGNPQQQPTQAPPMPPPTPRPRTVLCPYCGQISMSTDRCPACAGRYDPLSRQATQNSMGPWFIRDEANPMRPGCSYETIRRLVERRSVTAETILRGPSTRQFWTLAKRVPGVAHVLGVCHNCQAPAAPTDYACRSCGAGFEVDKDRQHMGLGPVRLLPGEAPAQHVAASTGAAQASSARGAQATEQPTQRPRPALAHPPSHRAMQAEAASAAGPSPEAVLRAMQQRLHATRLLVGVLLTLTVLAVGALVALVAVPLLVGELPSDEVTDRATDRPTHRAVDQLLQRPGDQPAATPGAASPPPIASPAQGATRPPADGTPRGGEVAEPLAPDPRALESERVERELEEIRQLIAAGERDALAAALARLGRFDPGESTAAAREAEALRTDAEARLRRFDLPSLP